MTKEQANHVRENSTTERGSIKLTEPQIKIFLDFVHEMPDNDINKRRAIINIFVRSFYLFDDHFLMLIHASGRPISIEDIPLENIEAAFEGVADQTEGCSIMSALVPQEKAVSYSGNVTQLLT